MGLVPVLVNELIQVRELTSRNCPSVVPNIFVSRGEPIVLGYCAIKVGLAIEYVTNTSAISTSTNLPP